MDLKGDHELNYSKDKGRITRLYINLTITLEHCLISVVVETKRLLKIIYG